LSGPGEPRPPAEPNESSTAEPLTPSAPEDRSTAEDGSGGPPSARPGSRTFSLEGRAAPGLYLIGWLGTIVGLSVIIVALLAGGGPAAVALLVLGLTLLSAGFICAAGAQAIQRRATGRTGYAGPSPILVFVAAVATSNLLVLAVAIVGRPLGLRGDTPAGVIVGLLVSTAVNIGLIRLLVVGAGSLSWADMGVRPPSRGTPRDIGAGVLLGVAILYLTALLALALAQILAQPPPQLPEAPDLVGRLATLVAAALIAPISEEIFFRGFVTTAWARTGSPRRAIVQGGLFFAFTHILTLGGPSFALGAQWALFAFLVRLPVSFALGWIFLRRSIYASIAMHAAFNGLPLLLMLLLTLYR
jgi:membrane protease YdiL (CAAX protease family)